jgi:cation transport regulator ChaC
MIFAVSTSTRSVWCLFYSFKFGHLIWKTVHIHAVESTHPTITGFARSYQTPMNPSDKPNFGSELHTGYKLEYSFAQQPRLF